MPQPRSTSLWRFLGVFACLGVLIAAALLLWGDKSARENPQQTSHSPHLPPPPIEPSVATTIPDPPEEWGNLGKRILLLADNSLPAKPQPPAVQPLEPPGKAEIADSPGQTTTQVIAASALEEALPRESGPSLNVGTEPAGQATAEQTAAPAVAQQPTAQAAPAPPAQPTAGPASKLALLPEWLRHLPETLASIPEKISDPTTTQSTSEPTPTAEPKPEPAPMPEAALKPQPVAEPTVEQKVDDSWREPEALIAGLKELAGTPAGNWATTVLRQLAALKPAMAAGSDETTAILDQLDQLSQQPAPMSAKLSDWAFARRWRQMGYALAAESILGGKSFAWNGPTRRVSSRRRWTRTNSPIASPKSRPPPTIRRKEKAGKPSCCSTT